MVNLLYTLRTRIRAGNFITGASGSENQMLCGSSRARAAPNITVQRIIGNDRFIFRRINLFL